MTCASPEVLGRFAGGDLSPDERGALLDHASSCESCHAAIVVMVPTSGESGDGPGHDREASDRIGRYTLGRVIGRGAMGIVYLARDPELERDVAVKVLRSHASEERLRREAQSLARLTHPNVVRIYDVGSDDARTFIAMELVDGQNLRQWLASPRTVDEIVRALVEAGRGLAAAHAVGLVHRDFKPDNVLVAKTGEVLVGDFGLARSADLPRSSDGAPVASALEPLELDSLTATGAIVGTPGYMAPEHLAGEATVLGDQYAFCVTAWEALFSTRPFAGATLAELNAAARAGQIRPPIGREVPRRIERALRRGLAADPNARFPSMRALLGELAPSSRRRPWIAAIAAAAALGVTGIVIASSRTTATTIRCADAAAALAPAWTEARGGALAKHFDVTVRDAFARYAARWQTERVEACKATHERGEQSQVDLAHRVACLDRARGELDLAVSTLLATPANAFTQPAQVVTTLPSIERCASPKDEAAPPLAQAPAISALEAELAAVEVRLAGGFPPPTAQATAELRARAAALGYPTQVLRASMLAARSAMWRGETSAAEATLREVMLGAERAGNDFVRAHAGALLATAVATHDPAAAGEIVAAARAALSRAGRDPMIDLALRAADVAIAAGRDDYRAAVLAQEALIAVLEARSTEPTDELIHAYNTLATMLGRAYEPDRWRVVTAKVHDLTNELAKRRGTSSDDLFRTTPLDRTMAGDFEGAVRIGRAQVAALRAMTPVRYGDVAYLQSAIAFAFEVDDNFVACLGAYRETEAAWSLPTERYMVDDVAPDTVAITTGRIEALLGIAGCLHGLGRYADEIVELGRAKVLAHDGGAATASYDPVVDRILGVAMVASGHPSEGRALLSPQAASPPKNPFPRAWFRFALAQALWHDGGLADRPRAHALVTDAEADLDEALTNEQSKLGALRKLPGRVAALRTKIDAWRAAHPLR